MCVKRFCVFLDRLRSKTVKMATANLYLKFIIIFSTITLAILVFQVIFSSLLALAPILYPIQLFETWIVYHIQKALGMPVSMGEQPTWLRYETVSTLDMNIARACAGIQEVVFLAALMFGLMLATWLVSERGIGVKRTAKWFGACAAFLFIENLIRLITFYPLGKLIGARAMWTYHYYFWKFGHLAIILALFVVWVFIAVRREFVIS